MPEPGERMVTVGRIGGAFGVAGWVKIQSYTDPPNNILNFPVWWVRQTGHTRWTEIRRVQDREASGQRVKGVQAKFAGIDTREAVAVLSGAEIGVRRADLPPLASGEFYWDDLLGLEVFSTSGERLGRVVDIRDAPAHPLLRVVDTEVAESDVVGTDKGARATHELLVPLVRERIKAVDVGARTVTVDWERDW